jgi:8-oxo-dGTP diphosphatase
MVQQYSLGFAFDAKNEHLLLITKNRPSWQAGLYNGIGGHMEEGETPIQCMVREYEEETGLRSEAGQWRFLLTFSSPLFIVHTYAMNSDDIHLAKSMTDETVSVVPVSLDLLLKKGVTNLPWLVGLALDPDQTRITVGAEYAA